MSRADGSTIPITRITRADAEAGLMRDHFERREPVIVEGLARDWPFMDRWSPERLVARMPDFVCTVSRDARQSAHPHDKGPGMNDITVIDGAGFERRDFTRLFAAREPAIIRGLARGWPLMGWSPAALVERMGDFPCKIARDSRPALSTEVRPLRDYFASLSHLSTMTFVKLDGDTPDPPFLGDLPLPNPFCDRGDLNAVFFYHANTDGGSLPHCHMDAVNVLQSGSKRWLLYDADPERAPAGAERLRQCHAAYGRGTHARDWFVDGPDGLRAAGIPFVEGVQRAGDVVYIPSRFAHGVLNLSEVMGMVTILSRPEEDYATDAAGRYSLHAARREGT